MATIELRDQQITRVSGGFQTTEIAPKDLQRLRDCGEKITKIAMRLTDHWGQAMFILDETFVTEVFEALNFDAAVAGGVYTVLQDLPYVHYRRKDMPVIEPVTWHKMDASCLALRGYEDPSIAMSNVDDSTVVDLLEAHMDLFTKLMGTMPAFTRDLMFAPEVASRVLGAFGADVSADKLYEMGWDYGGKATKDLEGRRGIPTQFIRSLSLTISASV